MATFASYSYSQQQRAPLQQDKYQHPPPLGGTSSENQFGFPIEGDDVLLSTLIKIGISDVKEYDLQKPTQQVALTCFTAFLELLSYVNDDVIDTLTGDCLDRLEHRDLYEDSLQTVIRFREIRALMIASCVADFTLADIMRPKPKRFKKQMFALINFLRFSEHHIQHFDRLKEENDQVFKERDAMLNQVQDVERRIQVEEDIRRSQEGKTAELREVNASLSGKLRSLKEEQSRLLNDLEDAKQDKSTVHAKLLRLIEASRLLHEEIEKLSMRVENTPNELRSMIEKQKRQLREKRATFVEEEVKAQSMHEKKKVLDALEVDIASCIAIVEACVEEQAKLMREKHELESVQRDMQSTGKDSNTLDMQLEQLREKMRWALERLERTQKNIESKREENKRKMDQGIGEWEAVHAERARRTEMVKELAREMAELEQEYEGITRNFDTFYAELLAQKERLESYCQEYMKTISTQTDLQVDF